MIVYFTTVILLENQLLLVSCPNYDSLKNVSCSEIIFGVDCSFLKEHYFKYEILILKPFLNLVFLPIVTETRYRSEQFWLLGLDSNRMLK